MLDCLVLVRPEIICNARNADEPSTSNMGATSTSAAAGMIVFISLTNLHDKLNLRIATLVMCHDCIPDNICNARSTGNTGAASPTARAGVIIIIGLNIHVVH